MKKIFLLLPLIVFTSCMPIAKVFYGVKNPKIIEKEKILDFVKKYDFAERTNYALDVDGYIYRMKNGSSVPYVEFFDGEGNLLIPNERIQSGCNDREGRIVSALGDSLYFTTTDSIKLNTYLDGLTTLDGEKVEVALSDDINYHIVVNWAIFVGKLNEEVPVWEAQLDSFSAEKHIEIYRVNLDPQTFWPEDSLEFN